MSSTSESHCCLDFAVGSSKVPVAFLQFSFGKDAAILIQLMSKKHLL